MRILPCSSVKMPDNCFVDFGCKQKDKGVAARCARVGLGSW